MKRSLEQAWREISTELDEVLDLEPPARRVWLAELEVSDPERAERVRAYIADLDRLESDNFLGLDLPAVLAIKTSDLRRNPRNEPILARSQSIWSRARKFLRDIIRRIECVYSRR
jgi:hypothetical protein